MAKSKQSKAPVAHIEGNEPAKTTDKKAAKASAPAAFDFSWEADKSAKESSTTEAEHRSGVQVSIDEPEAAEPSTAAAEQATGENEAPAAPPAGKGPMAWVARTFPGHEHAVLGGVLGLLVALLFFAIGFWQALLVCLAVFAGVTLGQFLDGDPRIWRQIKRLIIESRESGE